MINSTPYRGFTILINVGSGGWIIQRLERPTPESAQAWIVHASVPGPADDPSTAMAWVDAYFARGGK